MKFGAHAVLFTTAIATNTDRVLDQLSQAGADGVEIGSRFFGVDKSQELKNALERHGLELSGLHAGIPLLQILDAPGQAEATLERCASFLQGMPNKNIIMTGGIRPDNWNKEDFGDTRLGQQQQVVRIARTLDEFADKLRQQYGARLCYHNHNWEFANGAIIFEALLSHAPTLCFALDTGWAVISGYDPVELISRSPERFVYAHLRDYDRSLDRHGMSFEELQQGYLEIGEGDMDFDRLLTALHSCMGRDGFAVVEYECGPVNADRYAKALRFIRKRYEMLRFS